MTDDPLSLFHEWIEGDEMVLATATADGRPSARMLLLKAADERGFTFFSNYESRKGRGARGEPARRAALPTPTGIQVRVEGRGRADPGRGVRRVLGRPARPGSRRSAAASRQSQPIGSRGELEAAVAAQPEEPPRPRSLGRLPAHRPTRTSSGATATTACTNVTCSGDAATSWEVLLLQP